MPGKSALPAHWGPVFTTNNNTTGQLMVTIIKCQCGLSTCTYYGVSNDSFNQGNGWNKETAEFVAWCFNEQAVQKLWEFHKLNYTVVDTRP